MQLTEEIVLFVLPQTATFVAFARCRSHRSLQIPPWRLQWKAQRQAAHFRGGKSHTVLKLAHYSKTLLPGGLSPALDKALEMKPQGCLGSCMN